ncbi:hypothetical protein PsWM33_01491 [Pseudovibrio sp. WM33]|nr:hypothetical protein PsWM33_01491 [Pseudovibrio sp. WM33]
MLKMDKTKFILIILGVLTVVLVPFGADIFDYPYNYRYLVSFFMDWNFYNPHNSSKVDLICDIILYYSIFIYSLIVMQTFIVFYSRYAGKYKIYYIILSLLSPMYLYLSLVFISIGLISYQ